MTFSDAVALLDPALTLCTTTVDGTKSIFSIRFLSDEDTVFRPKTLYIGHIRHLPDRVTQPDSVLHFILLGTGKETDPPLVDYKANIAVLHPDSYTVHQLYDLMSDGMEAHAKFSDAAEQMTNALLSNSGLQHLIDVAFDVLGNPVWVVDSANKLIAHAFGITSTDEDGAFGELITNAKVLGHVPDIEKNDLAKIESSLARSSYHRFFHETFQREMIIRSVRVRGITVGFVCLLAQYHPLTDQDEALLRYLSSLLCQELQKSGLHSKNAGDMRAFFLNDLISSQSLHHESVELWQRDAGFIAKKYLYVAIITPSDGSSLDMAVVASQLQLVLIDSIFLVRGNELVVLININFQLVPDHDFRTERNSGRQFLVEDALRRQAIANKLSIGISNMFHDLMQTKEYYRQAKKIVSIHDRYLEWDVTYFSTAAPMEILHIVQSQENLLHYCVPELLDLLRVDQEENSELTKTLFCYLETLGNTGKAAPMLHIHKNTLLYRLEKIRNVLGDDLKSGESVFKLMMSFRILCTLKIFEPPFHPLELPRFMKD